jgi:hypothetical protein
MLIISHGQYSTYTCTVLYLLEKMFIIAVHLTLAYYFVLNRL